MGLSRQPHFQKHGVFIMNQREKFSKKVGLFVIFAGPSMVSFIMFVVIPFFYGIYLTMTDWDGIAKVKGFVGLQNYVTLLQDEQFWGSIGLTIKYVIAVVILVNIISFLLAVLLTSGIRGEKFLRAGFFTPNLIGGIILGFIDAPK